MAVAIISLVISIGALCFVIRTGRKTAALNRETAARNERTLQTIAETDAILAENQERIDRMRRNR